MQVVQVFMCWLQWLHGNMLDCSVCEPMLECHCRQLCAMHHENHCDIQGDPIKTVFYRYHIVAAMTDIVSTL